MKIPWDRVDSVLLDMDGTLLDLYFDDYFWLEFVPREYAKAKGISAERAAEELTERYRREEGSLNWTDLDFWSAELGLDIPLLKTQVEHLIRVHPYVETFLAFLLESGKDPYLVTNAHGKTLDLKMRKTRLGPFFREIVSAHEIGVPKEDPAFWSSLIPRLGFDASRALLAEDTEANLRAAREAGIGHLIFVARPSTRGPVRRSSTFPSILFFNELLPGDGTAP